MASRIPRPTSGITVLPPTEKKLVTAALDFGTAYSGFAYSFFHEPLTIHTNTWEYGGYTQKQSKAPSSVLLKKDGSFHSFGFDAEEKYNDLTENEDHEGWYFFERFKMKLYSDKKLSLKTKIYDIEGKEKPAIKIFTMVIADLKRRLLESVRLNKGEAITTDDIFWVLTVPAIWSDSAKQFMHVAAIEAGITSDQLRLVLEPEAASFYCQAKNTIKRTTKGKATLRKFEVGFRYVIIDLGDDISSVNGGTDDIASHEVLEKGNLREIFRASGDELGSCQLDEAFVQLMKDLFGEIVIERFKKEQRSSYRDLLADFEEKKRKVHLDSDAVMRIKMPYSFVKILGEESRLSIEENIRSKENFVGKVRIRTDKLELSPGVVADLFEKTVQQIVEKVRQIISTVRVDAVIAVGGFSESPYVKQSIQRLLNDKDTILLSPPDPGNHVMNGATLTNIFPNKIAERISRYSYGFRVEEPYEEHKHMQHKSSRESGIFCEDVYYEIIPIGKVLKYNATVSYDKIGGRRDTRKFEQTVVEFWCSDRENTTLCIPDQGCRKVGTIELIPPKEGWPDEVHFSINLRIGEAEFCITVTDKITEREFKTKVDFLTD